ncbi:Pfam:efhand [Geosmithia morbida]|uniref:Pfam:efhand n=1 Tax=Geosmithia morbida TaxID=1094350 RepID=A0A9P4YYC7_9HYPO|nr:Pfam:efhand [Geosmithia morbida]KAF4124044.1 Pfam:efhand [Geosmithia morbida]
MAYRQPQDPDALPRGPVPQHLQPTQPTQPRLRLLHKRSRRPLCPPRRVQARPPASSRPPPTPGPDGSAADPTLLPLFRAVDKDGGGQLSERELSTALVNGDWTAFDPQTVRMMIRMFDTDRSGTIGFDEFCGLWSFLGSWRTLFDRFDVDRSGNISLEEFSDALVAFRYRLSAPFVELLFRTYDKRHEGVMSFDLFVQACISLKRMTDVFKKYDDDRDGYITLSFEDFLSEILKQLK